MTTTENTKNEDRVVAKPKETKTTGKGMPDKTPQAADAQVGKQRTQRDASAEASLELPHERDQSTDMTQGKPSAKISQAKHDVDSGKQDTSKQPEMDTAYKKQK